MNRSFVVALAVLVPTVSMAQAAASRTTLIARMDEADSNRDGDVTRAELIAWRQNNFARFDRNRDRVLSDADIPRVLRGSSINAQFDSLKTQFDMSRDGRVTRDEFMNAPTTLFDAADLDRDNVLTRAERDVAIAAARQPRD